MAQGGGSSRFRTPSGGPLLREAPLGTRLVLKDQSIVEIVGNPGDGGWLQVRYVETPTGAVAVGEERWVFFPDVQDFAQDMGDLGPDEAPMGTESGSGSITARAHSRRGAGDSAPS